MKRGGQYDGLFDGSLCWLMRLVRVGVGEQCDEDSSEPQRDKKKKKRRQSKRKAKVEVGHEAYSM